MAVGAAAGALMVIVLGVLLHHRGGTRFDADVLRVLHDHVTGRWVQLTLDASTPVISVVLLVVVLAAAVVARRWRLALLAVAAPAAATGLTQYVLKPVVDRPYETTAHPYDMVSLAYPSGHETLVASAALVVLIAICTTDTARAVRGVAAVVLTLWTLMAGVGLVVNLWHFTTDVIGAVGLSAGVVLGMALLVDAASSLNSPGARDRPRTTHAA